MHQNLRAAIAFVVASLINRHEYSSIYDFTRGTHVLISGEVANGSVGIFDHEINAHVSGDYSQGEGSLYHHGLSCHVSLEWGQGEFSGFVHGNNGGHFTGQVNGDGVTLYAYSTSTHYQFSVN